MTQSMCWTSSRACQLTELPSSVVQQGTRRLARQVPMQWALHFFSLQLFRRYNEIINKRRKVRLVIVTATGRIVISVKARNLSALGFRV